MNATSMKYRSGMGNDSRTLFSNLVASSGIMTTAAGNSPHIEDVQLDKATLEQLPFRTSVSKMEP